MKKYLAILAVFVVFVGTALAHNGMLHVMGTVTAITSTNITVKTTDGKTQTVQFTADTKYIKGTTAIALKDIEVGDRVVIHATKKGDQLNAAEVQVRVTKTMAGDMSGRQMNGSKAAAQ